MEVSVREDTVDSGKSKALSTLFGFILPESIALLFLCSILLCLLQIIATYALHIVYLQEVVRVPVFEIYKWEQTEH